MSQASLPHEAIDAALLRLENALAKNRSERYCFSLWSRFVRMRDGSKCVACHATSGLSAHHIFRKSFLREARLQTGNGITLCKECKGVSFVRAC